MLCYYERVTCQPLPTLPLSLSLPLFLSRLRTSLSSLSFLSSTPSHSQVRQICSSNELLPKYQRLFSKGYQDANDLNQQMESAFGDSFAYLDPTLLSLMDQAQISSTSGPNLEHRQKICSTNSFASAMSLDQIVRLLCLDTHSSLIPSSDDVCLPSLSLCIRRFNPASSHWRSRFAQTVPRKTTTFRS